MCVDKCYCFHINVNPKRFTFSQWVNAVEKVLDTVLEIEGTPFLVPLRWPHPKLPPPEVGHPSQFHTAQTPPGKKERENFNDKR